MSGSQAIGVVGLGQMGRGIAANLDKAGLLAAAFDVAPGAFEAAGLSAPVRQCAPRAMAGSCDTILFVVPASPQIEASLDGPSGLLSVPHDGQVLIDLTTSYPQDTRRLAGKAAKAGRAYIDCGMTGGAAGATAGTLTLMAGGEAVAIDSARPVFDVIAAKLFHVGASGAGHTLKLLHNMVLHTTFLATCEGCLAAERAGLDLAAVIDVFNAGNARSFVSEVRFPKHILSKTFDGNSYVGTLAKDLAMAARYLKEIGAPAAYGPLTARLLDEAVAHGLAREDFTRLYQHYDALFAGEAGGEEGA